MNAGERVLGYVRVSTGGQADNGVSLDAQEAAIRRWAKGARVELVGVLRDGGESGTTLERPGLQEALERIAAGEAGGLVAAKLDRLSRSLQDLADLFRWFDDAGARLAVLDFDLDTSTAAGKMVASIMGAAAEFTRDQIAESTRAALQEKRERGEAISRPTVPPHVRKTIERRRRRGWTLQRIADKLNDESVPTARGAAQWHPSSVSSALGYRQRKPRRRAELPSLDGRRRRS
jgi:DNA invertase Pin-like site-specific DNA recombinase